MSADSESASDLRAPFQACRLTIPHRVGSTKPWEAKAANISLVERCTQATLSLEYYISVGARGEHGISPAYAKCKAAEA